MKYLGMIMEYPPVSSKMAANSPNSMEVFGGVIFMDFSLAEWFPEDKLQDDI